MWNDGDSAKQTTAQKLWKEDERVLERRGKTRAAIRFSKWGHRYLLNEIRIYAQQQFICFDQSDSSLSVLCVQHLLYTFLQLTAIFLIINFSFLYDLYFVPFISVVFSGVLYRPNCCIELQFWIGLLCLFPRKKKNSQSKPTPFNESIRQLKQLNEEEMKIKIDAWMESNLDLIFPYWLAIARFYRLLASYRYEYISIRLGI